MFLGNNYKSLMLTSGILNKIVWVANSGLCGAKSYEKKHHGVRLLDVGHAAMQKI